MCVRQYEIYVCACPEKYENAPRFTKTNRNHPKLSVSWPLGWPPIRTLFFEMLRSPHLFRCEMTRWSRICLNLCNILSFWGGTPQMFIFKKIRAILRGVSKTSIAALYNKNKLIGRDEYSRLMVFFLREMRHLSWKSLTFSVRNCGPTEDSQRKLKTIADTRQDRARPVCGALGAFWNS